LSPGAITRLISEPHCGHLMALGVRSMAEFSDCKRRKSTLKSTPDDKIFLILDLVRRKAWTRLAGCHQSIITCRCPAPQSSHERAFELARQKIDRTGEPSITETERPRSANLLQMPRGLTCKLRQRGRDYGGRAGFRGIDPSLQPLPICSNCWGRPLWTGGIPDDPEFKPQFRARPIRLATLYCAVRGPALHLRVPYFRPSTRTPLKWVCEDHPDQPCL
jgi:hypothetical protein